ncbi:porin [Duganella sp. FT80W]|uniref:Porin n=1 Tax=Duganella guangzhouensis TaxID=2666084 RepID=A0A6I2LBA1_9BURK|nr:porin [Duganella guangzhouensis]MRW93549.1 porin [Duganella guangzhouensis]
MKKAIAIAATAFVATAAHAQSNVTIYGIIDAAVETYTNADAAGNSVTRMPTLGGGMFPSRLGFRGSEDLGDGLKAIFQLENGFAPDTGAQNQNRLFGRQAWVGLQGKWGQLTLGRNYNMLNISTYDFDILGPSQYGLGSLDSFIPNGRSDNSLAYRGTFSGVTLGATYSLGRDTSTAGGASGTSCAGESATDAIACREWSTMVRYDAQSFSLVGAFDRIYGGAGAANGLTSSDKTDSRGHIAALIKQDDWKVGAGWIARNNQGSTTQPRSDLFYIGAAYNVTPFFTLDGQIATLNYKATNNDSKQILIRGIYNLSKRSAVYVAAGHISNDGTAAVALSAGGSVGAGKASNGLITGIKHSF